MKGIFFTTLANIYFKRLLVMVIKDSQFDMAMKNLIIFVFASVLFTGRKSWQCITSGVHELSIKAVFNY